MLLPAVANLPETCVRFADAADRQLRQMGQERVEVFATQIAIPFVEKDRRKGQNHFSVSIVLHMLRRLVVAANRSTASIAGPIRMLSFRQGKALAQCVDRTKRSRECSCVWAMFSRN